MIRRRALAAASAPDLEAGRWCGLVASAGTPRQVAERLSAGCARIMAGEEPRPRLAAVGADTAPGTPGRFHDVVAAERARRGKLVRDAGPRPDRDEHREERRL